jgi:PKD repeat protein
MKKHLLTLSICLVLLFAKTAISQSWVEKMQDPTVNFYEVQKDFNKKYRKQEKEMSRERFEAFRTKQKQLEKYARKGIKPPKEITEQAEEEEEAEIPGWEVYKRWEDYMKPRVYPSGDRAPMIAAMNDYLDNFYATGGGSGSMRGMSGGGTTPTTMAANWSLIGPSTTIPAGGGAGRVNFVRFDPSNTSIIWVGSPDGGLWKSTTGGTAWTTNTDNLPLLGCSDLAINPLNNQIMYLATGDGDASDTYSLGVLKSTDGGTTWNTTGLNWAVTNGRNISRLLINPVNPNTIFAATSNGVYRSINAGANWSQIASAIANMKDIEYKPGDTTTIYVASTTRFYKSTNGGTTFTNITSGLPVTTAVDRLAIAVTAANPAYVYVLGSLATDDGFQGLYRSTDNGTTFTTRATTPNLLGWSSTGSDTGGQGWYDLSLAASPTNADLVLVGGVNIWKSTNGGTTWTINAHWTGSGAPYVHADCHALEFIPGSATTYYAGCDGGCFRTTTAGTSWSDLSNGLQIAQPYRLGLSATNSNLLVTGFQDNGTNRWSGTSSWNYIQGGDGMEAIVDWSNANVQYGELYYGDINRTTTGGNLTTNIVATGGTGVNADGDWVTPYIMNPQKSTTLIVGKAQAYRSRNRGTAWTALGTITGGTGNLIALAYAPSDSNYIYMAKINKFYASTNSGTTFIDRTGTLPVASAAITYIAVASNNPSHVWVTFSGYSAANKVWYSADAGVTWTNYTTGLPNLPANCIVYQNGSTNDALYVGTDVGVYYRDNTAGSWTAYNTGLPNVIVKELEIQYTVSKLRAATFGRGIWQSDLATPGTSPPVADFSANRTNICIGDCINFTDLSAGTPTSWSWSFPGAATTTSTVQNPTGICYNTAGTYNVTLTATNANGSNAITKTTYITVSGTTVLPLVEGFQGTYLPAGWYQNNPDADNTWAKVTTAGGFATSTASAMMDSYSPASTNAGTLDDLITPKYSFTGVSTAQMTFDVAYARYNATYRDSLVVYVSTNCGVSWTQVYSKGGFTGLQTAPDNSTSMFVPTSTQWRTETVNMTPYAGQANVSVKFTSVAGWGQAMYLDNINITGTGAPVASVSIAQTTGTNPMCSGATATFTATPTNGGTTPIYQWQVNGVNVGTNSPTYTTTTLTNGQIVTCIMTSNLSGVTGSPATSNAITMTVNPTPATPTATSNSPVCTGTTINLSTATVAGATYSWTGPSTFTSTSQNPSRSGATVAMAGTYSVTVTSVGCTSLAGTTVVVVNTTPAAPVAGSNSPVCAGSSINLTATTVAGATYSWTGPSAYTSTSQNPVIGISTTAMAGTYSVTASISGCSSAPATTTVVVNPLPTVTVNSATICAGATTTLTATPSITGGAYLWSPGAATTAAITVTPLTTTTYTVTYTLSGCSSTGTGTVTVNTTPATPTAGSNSPVCSGTTLNLTASTVAGATYSWTGPSSYTASVQNPTRPTSTVAMSGTYSVTATVGGCTSPAATTVVVVNQTPATPAAGSNSPVCSGTSINLTAPSVAGGTYSWTGPLSFTSTAQNPTIAGATTGMAGTYSVTATANGCTSAVGTTAVVVNSSPAAPIPNINGSASPAAICAGGTITLTANNVGGATYSWTGPNSYTAGVRNPPALTNATVAMGGTYSLTVTVGGCTSSVATVSIGVTPIPATPAAGSNSPVCLGSPINLTTPTVAGATYSWTGPSTFTSSTQNPSRPSSTLAMAGTYSVTITVSGCTSAAGTTAVVVSSSVTPAVTIAQTTGSNPMCAGSSATFTATPTNGGTTPVYQWQLNGSNVGTNSPTYTNASLTNGQTITCIMTSGSACASPASVTSTGITMTVNPVPSAPAAGSNSPVCSGSPINLTASAIAGATYSWSGPSTFSSATQNPSISGSAAAMAGTYSVTATVSGCTSPVATTAVVVNTSVTPTISIAQSTGTNPMCAGSAATFTATSTNGGVSPGYQWQLNGSNTATGTSYSPASLSNGDVVTCILTSNAVCASPASLTSNSITMVVNPAVSPTVSISIVSGSNPMCSGQMISFFAAITNGGTTPVYQWQLNGSNVGSSISTYTSATIADGDVVTCTLSSNANCASPASLTSNSITMTVNANVTPAVSISAVPSGPICQGDLVTFTASPVNEGSSPVYQWQVNGVNSGTNSPVFSSSLLNNSDVVTCQLTSSATCATIATAGSNSITMTVNPLPPTPTITQAGSTLTSSAASGNQWYLNGVPLTGETGQTYTFLTNGNYTVIATVAGCPSDSAAVVSVTNVGIDNDVNPYGLSVYPNPNDGHFTLSFFAPEKSSYKVEITNAIGQKVFFENLEDFSGAYLKQLSVVEFGQGVYTVSLTNSKNETVKKIIVY